MSKGSNPRPHDLDKFNENFEKIFGRKRTPKKKKRGEKAPKDAEDIDTA